MPEQESEPISRKAHSSALLATEAEKRGDYEAAAEHHGVARKCFRKILKAIPTTPAQHGTREALKVIVEHHRTCAKNSAKLFSESKGNAKRNEVEPSEDVSSKTEMASRVPNTQRLDSPIEAPNKPTNQEASEQHTSSSNSSNVPLVESVEMQSVTSAFREVMELAEKVPSELKTKLPGTKVIRTQSTNAAISNAGVLHSPNEASAKLQQNLAKDAGVAQTSPRAMHQRANLSESFFFVQRGGVMRGTQDTQRSQASRGNLTTNASVRTSMSSTRSGNQALKYGPDDILLLSETLKTVSKENTNLLKEREALSKAIRERSVQYEQLKTLKLDYRKRFAVLKAAMEVFFRSVGHTEILQEMSQHDASKLEDAQKRISELEAELKRQKYINRKLDKRQQQIRHHAAKVATQQASIQHSNLNMLRQGLGETQVNKTRATHRSLGSRQRKPVMPGP